jgi:hypothetical protein
MLHHNLNHLEQHLRLFQAELAPASLLGNPLHLCLKLLFKDDHVLGRLLHPLAAYRLYSGEPFDHLFLATVLLQVSVNLVPTEHM